MTTAGEDGGAATFTPDFDDEIVAGSAVTHAGAIVHEPTREAIEGPAPEAALEPDPVVEPVETPEAEPAAEPTETQQLDLPYDQEADQ
jgi:NAD(P) transhydrogenase subunit alpha